MDNPLRMKERDMTVLRREEEHDICIKQACTQIGDGKNLQVIIIQFEIHHWKWQPFWACRMCFESKCKDQESYWGPYWYHSKYRATQWEEEGKEYQ